MFLELQPESVPCFVCKDLSRLPPLSMNNFDLSGVMRSIESLKAEMELMKDTQKSTIASQIELTQHVKHQTTRPCESHVNTETRQSTHSPVRPRPRIPAHTPVRTITHTSMFSDEAAESGEGDDSDLLRLAHIQGHPMTRQQRPRYSDVTRHNRTTEQDSPPRRRPPRGSTVNRQTTDTTTRADNIIIGNGKGLRLRASKRQIVEEKTPRNTSGIFISRMDRFTTTAQIERHIHQETNLKVKCEQLTAKHDSYKSFYVRLSQNEHKKVLTADMWPVGAIVRQYFD